MPWPEILVRLDMSIGMAETIAELTPRLPPDLRARVRDQLWLNSVFISERNRQPVAERARFTERANRILALLDPQEDD